MRCQRSNPFIARLLGKCDDEEWAHVPSGLGIARFDGFV